MVDSRIRYLDDHAVLSILLAIRALNAVSVRTFFQPDEYYQALEPAWNFAFGDNSGAWITWEWNQHLRSAIHPAIFSTLYWLIGILSTESTSPYLRDGMLLYGPKMIQAAIAALGDYYTWKLSRKIYQSPWQAFVTLCLTVCNPWQWFCSTRTFSNGFESTLTAAALYYWPFHLQPSGAVLKSKGAGETKKHTRSSTSEAKSSMINLRMALVLAATATIIRPTNILIWIVLACYTLKGNGYEAVDKKIVSAGNDGNNELTFDARLVLLAREALLCGISVLAISFNIDRAFYGVWTFPALNFLYFNVIQSLAVFYGNNDWHYYISQGYPLLLTTFLPFTITGMVAIFRGSSSFQHLPPNARISLKQLAMACVLLPAALSVLSHKEVRFIYPILAPLHIITAQPIWRFFSPLLDQSKRTEQQNIVVRGFLLVLLLSLNLLIAGYTSLTHNSGIIALPDYIRNEFNQYYAVPTTNTNLQTPPQNLTLAILMPCHSLPWRSHLLNPPTSTNPGIQAWALTCEPPLHLTSPDLKQSYLDEADIFYANPALWLRKTMSRRPPSDFTSPAPSRTPKPGIHTAPSTDYRYKHLWSSNTHLSHSEPEVSGLDITDLLPYLRTAPGKPPLIDEADVKKRPWPHYLAFFEQLEETMFEVLRGSGYVECWRVFNTAWHDDWRRKGDVVVWCLFPERARNREGSVG